MKRQVSGGVAGCMEISTVGALGLNAQPQLRMTDTRAAILQHNPLNITIYQASSQLTLNETRGVAMPKRVL